MVPGGVTFGRLLEVYDRNASESTCTPVLALEPEPFVTVSFEMVGGTALRKEANQTPVKEVTMPEEPKKSLRDVYQNIGPALTLTPEDFGFTYDPETGRLINQETHLPQPEPKDDHGTI